MPDPALTQLATAVLDVPAPERALVCGCEDGEPVLFLAREFPSARVRGTDPSAARVRAASARIGLDPEGRVAFRQSSPRRLPFPDGFFDLVVIFEGRPSPREITRVMAPGARLIAIPSPPAGRLDSLWRWLWQRRLPRAGI